MGTKEIQTAICIIPNRELSCVLYNAFSKFHRCQNIIVFGNFEKRLRDLTRGNRDLFKKCLNLLIEILKND